MYKISDPNRRNVRLVPFYFFFFVLFSSLFTHFFSAFAVANCFGNIIDEQGNVINNSETIGHRVTGRVFLYGSGVDSFLSL